jgi:chromosomal replication initiator protein
MRESPVHDGTHIWQQALAELQSTMPQRSYSTWLRDTHCLDFDGAVLTVGVPDPFHQEYLEKKVPALIGTALRTLGCDHIRVRYTVAPSPAGQSEAGTHKARANGRSPSRAPAPDRPMFRMTQESASPDVVNAGMPLNPRYVFETFISGGGNQLAHAACRSVADNPAGDCNPLFIWGSVGLGKTHLLHAIGHEALHQRPESRVLLTSSENFMNDMIGAIRRSRTEEFREYYRHVDILLIDDIHFIAGKESTQEEFFHTFNALHDRQKQIVMTSDRHPKSMTTLEDRLRSRFEWGLIADIQVPDLENRIAILRAKAQSQAVPVPRDVISYLARRIDTNVRELEGALKRLIMTAKVQNKAVTLDLAIAELEAGAVGARRAAPTVDDVVAAVTKHYGVTRENMLSPSRERSISLPRQVAMYLMREEARCSLPRIGEYLGNRDHSTITHGCDRIAAEVKNENIQVRKDIAAIRNALYADRG